MNKPANITYEELFQSPRSGQICLNDLDRSLVSSEGEFQSPRSGQICLNEQG